jgi:hypothetical protein
LVRVEQHVGRETPRGGGATPLVLRNHRFKHEGRYVSAKVVVGGFANLLSMFPE